MNVSWTEHFMFINSQLQKVLIILQVTHPYKWIKCFCSGLTDFHEM